jgi:homoserine dehydrogenase
MVHAAFGVHVPPGRISTRGLDGTLIADDNTHVWRLIARAKRARQGVTVSVTPEQVLRTSFLGQTAGAENRLEITVDGGDIVRLAGQGAGRWPTTTAVMGDVQEIARRRLWATAA